MKCWENAIACTSFNLKDMWACGLWKNGSSIHLIRTSSLVLQLQIRKRASFSTWYKHSPRHYHGLKEDWLPGTQFEEKQCLRTIHKERGQKQQMTYTISFSFLSYANTYMFPAQSSGL